MTSAARPRVLVAAPLADDLIATLRERFDVRVMPAGTAAEASAAAAALVDAEGLVLSDALRITAELLDACPRLRVVSKIGVGYDRIDVVAASARQVLVCNTPAVLNGAVADLTFAILLALTRRLRENDAHLRSGAWMRGGELLGHDIRGKTLGIIGFGGIGRTVARTASGFDMDVNYYRRTRDLESEAAGLASFRQRDAVFREADVVSVHCPLTSETRQSVGEREFNLMKPSSYFVNTSRGGVVDQPALVRALQSGAIAGAALDVMDPEPLDPSDPLCALSNVVLMPHIGSGTVETRRAMQELAVRNLVEGMSGRIPAASVNASAVRRDQQAPTQLTPPSG